MLPQRPEVGQRQPADPPGPVPASDPDERPGGLQGEFLSYPERPDSPVESVPNPVCQKLVNAD